MINVVLTLIVLIVLTGITAVVAAGFSREMRPWIWAGLAEYLLCAAMQLVYSRVIVEGGDTIYYTQTGAELAKFLDANFSWASGELLSMLLQQPSAFDPLVQSPGSNTGSMYAASAWLLFFFRGSDYACHFFISGLSFFGALSMYKAARDAFPSGSAVRVFAATVLFPSVAFWTSALHKEAFCLIGMGLLLAGWRAIYARRFRALLYLPLGLAIILLFRAPAVPPLLLGLVVHFAWERFQKTRGADTIILGPVYMAFGLGMLALGMIAVSRVSPALSIDNLAETMTNKQGGWLLSQGGSAIGGEDDVLPQTLTAQVIRFPVALLNALLRPQFFDVRGIAAMISAVEMTFITWMIVRALRYHGLRGVIARIQGAPFLMMCAVVTLVGCTFVGLVTLNFGSLARYRVPFLPFYGILIMTLSQRTAPAPVAPRPATPVRRTVPPRRLRGQRT